MLAALIILVMGTAFLKMDQSRVKWRFKLAKAFDKGQAAMSASATPAGTDKGSKSEKWALFLLPFITVVRVSALHIHLIMSDTHRKGWRRLSLSAGYVARHVPPARTDVQVSLGYPAKSIPIPVVVGLIVGGLVGESVLAVQS